MSSHRPSYYGGRTLGSHRSARYTGSLGPSRVARRPARAPTASTRLRAPAGSGDREEEEDFFSTGLTLRKVSHQTIRAWTGFQVLALVFQWSLWREVRQHLNLYEETLAFQCAPERSRHGICTGPMWNVSSWHEFILHGTGVVNSHSLEEAHAKSKMRSRSHTLKTDSIAVIDSEIAELEEETAARLKELRARRVELQIAHGLLPAAGNGSARSAGLGNSTFTFEFETRSSPPTFLLSVDPVSRGMHAGETPPTVQPHHDMETEESHQFRRWSLQVTRTDPPQTKADFHRSGAGGDVLTFEDLSPESQDAIGTRGCVRWQATVMNSDRSTRQTRFVSLVEDFRAPHLGQVHASQHCSFISAWKAFNKQHQGQSHQALSLCSTLLGIFLPVGALATYVVYAHVSREQQDTGEKEEDSELGDVLESTAQKASKASDDCDCDCDCGGYGFHTVVLGKFFAMDIPQQVCIVLYLLGWYEAEGLRCQLCLFHPEHCEDEHPFNLANSAAFLCTLLSSVANQIIIGPALKRAASEEDVCLRRTVRVSIVCVSILPFTTGVYWATSALLSTPALAQTLMFGPCVFGWLSILACVVMCLIGCCGD